MFANNAFMDSNLLVKSEHMSSIINIINCTESLESLAIFSLFFPETDIMHVKIGNS